MDANEGFTCRYLIFLIELLWAYGTVNADLFDLTSQDINEWPVFEKPLDINKGAPLN